MISSVPPNDPPGVPWGLDALNHWLHPVHRIDHVTVIWYEQLYLSFGGNVTPPSRNPEHTKLIPRSLFLTGKRFPPAKSNLASCV